MKTAEIIHTLENDFQSRFLFSFFSQTPASQISELESPVFDKDQFRSRLGATTALFDNLNKKNMDKDTGIKTEATRKSLESFLKSKFVNAQPFISDKIMQPIGMICLMRDYQVHGKNTNKEKAFSYFKISDPIPDYSLAWKSIESAFQKSLLSMLELLQTIDIDKQSAIEINHSTALRLLEDRLNSLAYHFENKTATVIVNEILERSPITDSELAEIFCMSKMQIRKFLYPFYRNMITARYSGIDETTISISPLFYKFKAEIKAAMGRK